MCVRRWCDSDAAWADVSATDKELMRSLVLEHVCGSANLQVRVNLDVRALPLHTRLLPCRCGDVELLTLLPLPPPSAAPLQHLVTSRRRCWSVGAMRQVSSGEEEVNDGVFWMPWDDAMKIFDTMHICRVLRPPHWSSHLELDEWADESVEADRWDFWNPQYQLHMKPITAKDSDKTVSNMVEVYVCLVQPSERLRRSHDDLVRRHQEQDRLGAAAGTPYDHRIGVRVISGAREGKRQMVHLRRNCLSHTGLVASRDCAFRLLLDPTHSPYTLMPVRAPTRAGVKGEETNFALELATSHPSLLQEIPPGRTGSVLVRFLRLLPGGRGAGP